MRFKCLSGSEGPQIDAQGFFSGAEISVKTFIFSWTPLQFGRYIFDSSAGSFVLTLSATLSISMN